MTKINIIIAGSRSFNDYDLLERTVDHYCKGFTESKVEIIIVSGGQRTPDYSDPDNPKYYGADYLGEKYASKRGYSIKQYPADWEKYKRAAGPIRNRQMGAIADCAIIFWDGMSKGSQNMIKVCKDLDIKYRVVNYLSKT